MARIFDYDVLEKIGEYGDYSKEKLVEINIPNELGLTKKELDEKINSSFFSGKLPKKVR